jgi:hypothetical protein
MPFIEIHIPNVGVQRFDVFSTFLPQDPFANWQERAQEREQAIREVTKLFMETMAPVFEEKGYAGLRYFFIQESKADPSEYLENAIDELLKAKQIT